MNVFVLDNYDSFTFNLVQLLGALSAEVEVVRNDRASVGDVARRAPDAVVISPGPGAPRDAGISIDLVRWCDKTDTPLLGVCLGHQAIAAAFGGRIVSAPTIMHGKASVVHHHGGGVLRGLPMPFEAMRYHSLVVEAASLPRDIRVTARTDGDVVMGVRHARRRIEGVQFHPESVLTADGLMLVRNFLEEVHVSAALR